MESHKDGGTSGILGLDRKAMEAARLARLAKKRAAEAVIEIDDDDMLIVERPKKIFKASDDTVASPHETVRSTSSARPISPPTRASHRWTGSAFSSKIEHAAKTGPEIHTKRLAASESMSSRNNNEIQAKPKPKLQYPDGVIKKTWCFGFPRSNDIKLEEVLQKNDLKVAVISSFVLEADLLATKFNTDTKFILVMHARTDHEVRIEPNIAKQLLRTKIPQREQKEQQFAGISRIRTCYPPLANNPYAYPCMHSKLMLLFHPDYLRIVVPTANFISFDWGETGVMENSVFLIDLPRLPNERQGTSNKTLTSFSEELLRFMDAMKIHDDAKEGVLKFDFSKTADIRFVHTIGSAVSGEAMKHTGFPGLSTAVQSLKMRTEISDALQVDMAASSIGSIDESVLDTLHRALRGLEDVTPSAASKSKTKKRQTTASLGHPSDFRILFPTIDTVKASKGGPTNGGTLFCRDKYFERATFPRESFHEYISTRNGLLSHNKLILARSSSNAFVYIGSHNLSQSAWGKISTDKVTKQPKFTAMNWECGIIMPVPKENGKDEADTSTANEGEDASNEGDRSDGQKVLPFQAFKQIIDVPFEWPPKKYGPEQKPWSAE